MTRPLPNSVKTIKIRIAIEDMTLWDKLFCGYPAGAGGGSLLEMFRLPLTTSMMNQFCIQGWKMRLCRLLLKSHVEISRKVRRTNCH